MRRISGIRVTTRRAGAGALALALAWPALGQPFSPPPPTRVRERLAGSLLSAPGAPAPEAGDQLLAFFQDTLLAVHTFTSDQADPRSFELLVIGDDPNTPAVEGPRLGQAISLRFFDVSTNFVRADVAALNNDAEVFNLTFQGREVIEIVDDQGNPLPIPIDLTPRRTVDALLGAKASDGGGAPGGGGASGGGGAAAASFDVDGDGRVTRGDAVVVIRLVIGARGAVSAEAASRADVNGDGVVDTRDAIAILRSRRG